MKTTFKTWVETHKKQITACTIVVLLLMFGITTGSAIISKQDKINATKTDVPSVETKDIATIMNDAVKNATDTTKKANADAETVKDATVDNVNEKENKKDVATTANVKETKPAEKPANNTQTQTQAPTKHQHNWKTNTTQRWVSNMVTVDDYEEQKVAVDSYAVFVYDGFKARTEAEQKQHGKELILAGFPSNYTYETIYETQRIKVGSHQEDHGHYETITYQYCDCGVTK